MPRCSMSLNRNVKGNGTFTVRRTGNCGAWVRRVPMPHAPTAPRTQHKAREEVGDPPNHDHVGEHEHHVVFHALHHAAAWSHHVQALLWPRELLSPQQAADLEPLIAQVLQLQPPRNMGHARTSKYRTRLRHPQPYTAARPHSGTATQRHTHTHTYKNTHIQTHTHTLRRAKAVAEMNRLF